MNIPWHFQISFLSVLLPLATGLIVFKYLSKDLRLFWYYIIVSFLTESTSYLLLLNSYKTVQMLNIFIIIEYTFLIYVISYWNNNKIIITAFKVSIPIFITIFLLLGFFNIERFDEIKMISRTVGMILLTASSIITLYVISDDVKVILYKDSRFWISSGILIYFAGNLLQFSLGTFIIEGTEIYFIHNALNIVANICYAGGLFCKRKQ